MKENLPSHSRCFVTGSQKCATAINKEEEIMSKNSHIDWSACAWARSWEKSQCRTKRFDSLSTPWIVLRCMSEVNLSNCLWMKASVICPTKSLKYSFIEPDFFTQVFLIFLAEEMFLENNSHAGGRQERRTRFIVTVTRWDRKLKYLKAKGQK